METRHLTLRPAPNPPPQPTGAPQGSAVKRRPAQPAWGSLGAGRHVQLRPCGGSAVSLGAGELVIVFHEKSTLSGEGGGKGVKSA